MTDSDRGKLRLIAELLCIKHQYFNLDLFNVSRPCALAKPAAHCSTRDRRI